MEADYAYMEMEQEQFHWEEEVRSYTERFTVQQLVLEAKEVLSEQKSFIQQSKFVKIRSLISHGLVHNHLTEKQRYLIGDFILNNS